MLCHDYDVVSIGSWMRCVCEHDLVYNSFKGPSGGGKGFTR